ncbi:MAG TPA: UDP-N-acetylmuramoyl-tripeptide--D-alanyl-D-alanine ligase [Burkholderiales bacterium]|nr:UDP-N-acetylmuramoyl-tripeptide--D-alanyl-D-alanine ligase [Burkholderiales bacterium]
MFDLTQAARAIDARLVGGNVPVRRVSTDSRDIREGDLFVALKGPRFDGHRFVEQARRSGAVAAMVSEVPAAAGLTLLIVDDTRLALGRLASWWRERFHIPLVAITGSNGKTTVKDMLASALRAYAGEHAVLATQGNLNNDIGVPLTLLGLRAAHRYAVVEMGMNHLGEIAYLSRLARPSAALINNAGTAHIGEVGSVEGIARAKGEIFAGLQRQGTAIINGDDAFADYWRGLAKGRRVVDFGLDKRATVRARYELSEGGSLVTVNTPREEFVVRLAVPGLHNVKNALAAATAAWTLEIAVPAITTGLSGYQGTKGRLQLRRLPNGALLIDDTYNANPESTKAALTVLGAYSARRLFVLGDMGELGEGAGAMHAEVGSFARRAGVERLFALGEASEAAVRSFGAGAVHFASVEALLDALKSAIDGQTVLLVKGSRFMRMERVVEALISASERAREGR